MPPEVSQGPPEQAKYARRGAVWRFPAYRASYEKTAFRPRYSRRFLGLFDHLHAYLGHSIRR